MELETRVPWREGKKESQVPLLPRGPHQAAQRREKELGLIHQAVPVAVLDPDPEHSPDPRAFEEIRAG